MKRERPDTNTPVDPGRLRRKNLGLGSGYRKEEDNDIDKKPQTFNPYNEYSPVNTTEQGIAESSGVDTLDKKEAPVNDYSDVQEGKRQRGRRGSGRAANDYSDAVPNKESFTKRRSEELARRTDSRRNKNALLNAAIKGKGNPAATAMNVLKNKDLRRSLWHYKWELMFATIGEVCGAIPFVGVVINAIFWPITYLSFKTKGVNLGKYITKGSFGMLNILAEIIVSPFAPYPGLIFTTVRAILDNPPK